MNNFTKLIASAVLAALAMLATLSASAHDHDRMQANNIVETAAQAGQFETLLAAATAAGLAPALSGEGPFTVFAPTDEAFGVLPAGTVANLLKEENRDQLANILKFHVVAGRVGSEALADGATLETLAGPRVTFTETEQGFFDDRERTDRGYRYRRLQRRGACDRPRHPAAGTDQPPPGRALDLSRHRSRGADVQPRQRQRHGQRLYGRCAHAGKLGSAEHSGAQSPGARPERQRSFGLGA